MSIAYFKSKMKPLVMHVIPKYYYRRLIKQNKISMNVNTLEILPTLSIPYNHIGKYPTMYEKPQSNYYKKKKRMTFDLNGVPLIEINGSLIYHPVYLIQYALSEYGFYLFSHDKKHIESAIKIADWLVQNQDIATGYWYYSYDYFHKYTCCLLKAPWASAMAQGQAISLLSRVYYITKDKKYVNAAISATKLLKVPIASGGLASDFFGHMVFEEYPTLPYSYTLNGFMFCALGLFDLSRVVDSAPMTELWEIAKSTLEFLIPFYDGDLMSLYCLSYITKGDVSRNWAEKYHPLHITLLQCFESIIPNKTFEFYIKRWAKFLGIKIK